MRKNIFFVFLGAVLLVALFLGPRLVLNKCPLGFLSPDNFPASCPLYTDQNQDQLCDITQTNLPAAISQPTQNLSFWPEVFQPTVLLVFGLLVLGTTLVFVKKWLWLRYISLLIGLIYLGFIKASLICPLLTLQMLFLVKERIVANLSVFLIFLLPIIFALLVGRIYCLWVCPLGASQEFVYKITNQSPICSGLSKKCQARLPRLTYLKYIILVIIILAVIFLRKPVLCGLDPFGALFGHFVTTLSLIALILFAIASVLIFRPWCKYFCPYGALLSLLAKIKIFRPKK